MTHAEGKSIQFIAVLIILIVSSPVSTLIMVPLPPDIFTLPDYAHGNGKDLLAVALGIYRPGAAREDINIPAIAQHIPHRMYAIMTILLVFIPVSLAASGLSPTTYIFRPSVVFFIAKYSKIIIPRIQITVTFSPSIPRFVPHKDLSASLRCSSGLIEPSRV